MRPWLVKAFEASPLHQWSGAEQPRRYRGKEDIAW